MREFRYKAFISYSHADRDWAAWLLAALESYRIPGHLVGRKTDLGLIPARLRPIFRDRDELPAAHRLTDRLFEALRASEYLIVLCSPSSAQSKMVNREIAEFKQHRSDGFILCMIVDGKPFSNDPATECFPPAILKAIRPDGSTMGFSPEGLAADVRPEGDGKRMGLIKIVAGMIGVGLNDIVRREEQRRQRRTAGILSAAGIAVAAMGGLLYEATNARKAASRAQAIAETRQSELEQELIFSNELTEFMMQDVYGRMLEIGDMATLEMITKKIISTFEEKGVAFRDDNQFIRYTAVLLRYGQMLERRGDSELAKYFFERTLHISTKYLAENPFSAEARFRVQNNHYFLAYLAMRQGRLATAQHHFERQLALLDKAETEQHLFTGTDSKKDGPKAGWITGQRSEARTRYGLLLAGPLAQADAGIVALQAAVEGYRSQLDTHIKRRSVRINLSEAQVALGYALLYGARITDAMATFENSLTIIGTLLDEDPDSRSARRQLMLTYQGMAKVAVARGRLNDAVSLLSAATEGLDKLVAHDDQNTMWLANAATAHTELAEATFRTGDHEQSIKALETGQRQIKEALARDDTRVDRHLVDYSGSLLRAEYYLDTGEYAAASHLLETLEEAFNSKNRSVMRVDGYILAAARTQYLLSRLAFALQDPAGARLAQEKAISLIETSEATRTMELKDLLAGCYAAVGRTAEESALLSELERYGYRPVHDNTAIRQSSPSTAGT